MFVTTHLTSASYLEALTAKNVGSIHLKPHSFTVSTRRLPSSEKIFGGSRLLHPAPLCTDRYKRLSWPRAHLHFKGKFLCTVQNFV